MGDRTKSSQHITKPTIPLATEAYLETHRAPRVPLEIGNLQGCRWILLRPTTMVTDNAMVDRDVESLRNLFENSVDGKATNTSSISLHYAKNKTQATRKDRAQTAK